MSATHMTDAELAGYAAGLKQHEVKAVANILYYQVAAPGLFIGDLKDRVRIFEAIEVEAKKRGMRVPKLSNTIRERAR